MAERAEHQLDGLEEKLQYSGKKFDAEMKEVEASLKKEIQRTWHKLEKNKAENGADRLLRDLEAVKELSEKEMGELRRRRKQRKEGFLGLLESIVNKCRRAGE